MWVWSGTPSGRGRPSRTKWGTILEVPATNKRVPPESGFTKVGAQGPGLTGSAWKSCTTRRSSLFRERPREHRWNHGLRRWHIKWRLPVQHAVSSHSCIMLHHTQAVSSLSRLCWWSFRVFIWVNLASMPSCQEKTRSARPSISW